MTATYAKSVRYVFTLLLFAVLPAVGADAKPWNQAEVLKLADQLVSAAQQLRIDARGHPSANVGDQRAHLTALYDVRHFQTVSHQLSDALEGGKGQADTLPMYRALVEAMGGMKAYMEAPSTSKWPPLEKTLQRADDILGEIGAYYSS